MPNIAILSLTILVSVLLLNAISLIGYRQNCYKRGFYGEKLLMRDDLTEMQRSYAEFITSLQVRGKDMIPMILGVPQKVFQGTESKPKEISDLWSKPEFEEFAKNDLGVIFKRRPILSLVFVCTIIFCYLVLAISLCLRGTLNRIPSFRSVLQKSALEDLKSGDIDVLC